MEYLTLSMAVISSVLAVTTFFKNKEKDSTKSAKDSSYEQGKTDQMLANIMEKLNRIEKKLDGYDKDIEEKIKIAMENHIAIYHRDK